ncbi:amidohydrolase family protein [Paraburkholderia sediminicola]|uniref:amidohydrolase family protein n=1 Tax=Paraburkholderia sediminicola TaxID=458836 RepID=UPI0038BC2F5C
MHSHPNSAAATSSQSPTQPSSMTGTIDVHSHALLPIWLEALRSATAPGVQPTIAGAPIPEWTEHQHIATMDAHGISASLLSWPRATAIIKDGGTDAQALARAMNEEFARIIDRNPARFGAFAALPIDDIDASLDEMAYALDVLKLDGICITTNVNGLYLGDQYFDDLLAEMHRRSATLFVHPTTPPGFALGRLGLNPAIIEYMFETTRMATNMVVTGAKARYSNINVICAHAGGTIPFLAPRISILEPQFGAGPGRETLNSTEIMDGLSSFYFDLTAGTRPASLDGLGHLVPTSKLLMGFDYPMMPATEIAPAMTAFSNYRRFDASDRALITHGNALRLFPRFKSSFKGYET